MKKTKGHVQLQRRLSTDECGQSMPLIQPGGRKSVCDDAQFELGCFTPHIYNTDAHIDRVIAGVEEALATIS